MNQMDFEFVFYHRHPDYRIATNCPYTLRFVTSVRPDHHGMPRLILGPRVFDDQHRKRHTATLVIRSGYIG